MGAIDVLRSGLNPQAIPMGIAITEAIKKPVKTVTKLVKIWSIYVGLPV